MVLPADKTPEEHDELVDWKKELPLEKFPWLEHYLEHEAVAEEEVQFEERPWLTAILLLASVWSDRFRYDEHFPIGDTENLVKDLCELYRTAPYDLTGHFSDFLEAHLAFDACHVVYLLLEEALEWEIEHREGKRTDWMIFKVGAPSYWYVCPRPTDEEVKKFGLNPDG